MKRGETTAGKKKEKKLSNPQSQSNDEEENFEEERGEEILEGGVALKSLPKNCQINKIEEL